MPKHKHKHVEMEVSDYGITVAQALNPNDLPYHLRVDAIPEDPEHPRAFNLAEFHIERLLAKYSVPGTPFLAVFEQPHGADGFEKANPNPHYHVFFQLTTTEGTFRNVIRAIWGKGNYCLKRCDAKLVPEMFNYFCKGSGTGTEDPPKIIYRSDDITDDIIVELHALYWKNNDAIQMEISKKPKRDEPASHQILIICKNKIASTNKVSLTEQEIIDVTFEWYATRKWSMNTFQMKAVITWVSYNLNPDCNRIHLAKQACMFQ